MLIFWAKRQGMIIKTVTLFYDSSKTTQKIMILDFLKYKCPYPNAMRRYAYEMKEEGRIQANK